MDNNFDDPSANTIEKPIEKTQNQAQTDEEYDERMARLEKKMAVSGKKNMQKRLELQESLRKKEEAKYLQVLESLKQQK